MGERWRKLINKLQAKGPVYVRMYPKTLIQILPWPPKPAYNPNQSSHNDSLSW
jgi:hypothetical protein